MCWIKQTATDVRIAGADNILKMCVMIDSAHTVHENMRGHTGGITSFGTGVVDQKSSKQKMSTRSSTKIEHVGTSEYLPKPTQGYKSHTILGKDNESEIRMLRNRKRSCTSNSKHVAIKYFWSMDCVQNGNIEVMHCPTDKILADYMSKPLQGTLFHTFRNMIMGWIPLSTLFNFSVSNEERVGENGKLPVKRNKPKLMYAEAMRVSNAVRIQNECIANGKEPTD